MGRSRIASVEMVERRKEWEQAAAEARRAERARRKAQAEEATRQYFAERAAYAWRRTRQLEDRVEELRTILVRGLRRDPRIDPARLRQRYSHPVPDLSAIGWRPTPPDWSRYEPRPPSVLGRVVSSARHQQLLAAAQADFEKATAEYERAEAERQRRFADARQRYAARIAQERLRVDEHNRAVDAFAAALRRREPDAICRHLAMVLDAVPLPRAFPLAADVDPAAVRFELPGPDVVPAARAVRYDERTDEQFDVPRPAEEIAALYREIVAQVVLLCLHDLFVADPGLDAVTFHGYARGERVVDVRTGRADFEKLCGRGLPPEVVLTQLGGDTALPRAS